MCVLHVGGEFAGLHLRLQALVSLETIEKYDVILKVNCRLCKVTNTDTFHFGGFPTLHPVMNGEYSHIYYQNKILFLFIHYLFYLIGTIQI